MDQLLSFITNNRAEFGSIVLWEFFQKSDLGFLQQLAAANLIEKVIVRNFSELMQYGPRAKVGDFAIVSRFHAHLCFLRLGVRGVVIVESGHSFPKEYYIKKHQSLFDAGSNWCVFDGKRFDFDLFPNIPDWQEFNAVNEKRKRECYERFFGESASQ